MRKSRMLLLAVLIISISVSLLACEKAAKSSLTNFDDEQTTVNESIVENTVDNTADNAVNTTTDITGEKVQLNLYFANSDNSAVPMEKREVVVKDKAVLRAAIEALLAGPENTDYRPAIPAGTKILGIKSEEDLVTVDFSKEYNNANDVAEIVERASVVNTLTDIKGINRVKILVQGKELTGPSGEPFGEMMKFKLDSKGYPIPQVTSKITLYFGDSNAEFVAAEKRTVEIEQGEAIEKVIIEELMKGPKTKGLFPVIPQGTKVLSVKTENGICELNLSHEFVDNNHVGTAGESMTLNSIVNSLTELPEVKKVQFLIDGQIREAYLHVVFDQPFERNESIIKK